MCQNQFSFTILNIEATHTTIYTIGNKHFVSMLNQLRQQQGQKDEKLLQVGKLTWCVIDGTGKYSVKMSSMKTPIE